MERSKAIRASEHAKPLKVKVLNNLGQDEMIREADVGGDGHRNF